MTNINRFLHICESFQSCPFSQLNPIKRSTLQRLILRTSFNTLKVGCPSYSLHNHGRGNKGEDMANEKTLSASAPSSSSPVDSSQSSQSDKVTKGNVLASSESSNPISQSLTSSSAAAQDVGQVSRDSASSKGSHDNSSPSALKIVTVVPGKGNPPEPPITCCGTGCANCVWIVYAEELRDYYKDGGEQARKALENIEDPSLKAFIKLELGL